MPTQDGKIKIEAFSDQSYDPTKKVGEYNALINPETYSLDYKIEFTEGQGHGTSTAHQRFNFKKPDEMSFEFLFDCSGIIDPDTVYPQSQGGFTTIANNVEDFKKLLLEYDSDSHEPKFFAVTWGTFMFKGRCNALTINFKLFNPDGSPIRAVCKATFKGSIDEQLRVAQEDAHSADITHYIVAKAGDTLPWLCYQVYGDSKYYIQVAQINNLDNFRILSPGQELSFPPIAK